MASLKKLSGKKRPSDAAAESVEMKEDEADVADFIGETSAFPNDDEPMTDEAAALPIGIRQMAAVLLSDTSESETEDCSKKDDTKIVNKDELIAEMYNTIRATAVQEKRRGRDDSFIKEWIKQQEKLYRDWKKKGNLTNDPEPANVVEPDKNDQSGAFEVPKITKLKIKPRYNRNQIEEEMSKMEPEKRERWENWFFQYMHGKPKKIPIFKSDLRKDLRRLAEANGRQNLIDHYKTELNNLKDSMRTTVTRLEQVMSELEAKDGKTQEVKKGEPAQELAEEQVVQESGLEEVSSASDEDTFLSMQEMEDYEEILSKNLLLPPNLDKIDELLETEIVFPEKDPETVQLGKTLKEVEKNLLETKGLDTYMTRIVYFFTYKSNQNADSVKKQYEIIVRDIKPPTETSPGCNKGSLIIYENVNMAIVMVEGAEFEVLKHLGKLKTSNLYEDIKKGKILYIHQFLVKTYFNKWVVRVESPPAGKIRYMTKSKKILYRTAASRVVRASEMLHKLYRHLSREEKYLIDPRSIYTKSKYIILLPSPALFAYLFKYNILRDIKTYLDELGMPAGYESEDESLFAFSEDVLYSNYVDTDEDEDSNKEKLKYAKIVVKEGNTEHRKRIKRMNDLKMKDSEETVSWDAFNMDEIEATMVDSRIKGSEPANHPALKLAAAMEAREARRDNGKRHKSTTSDSKVGFLCFVEPGSEQWYGKMKRHGIKMCESKASEKQKGLNVTEPLPSLSTKDRKDFQPDSDEGGSPECEDSFNESDDDETSSSNSSA